MTSRFFAYSAPTWLEPVIQSLNFAPLPLGGLIFPSIMLSVAPSLSSNRKVMPRLSGSGSSLRSLPIDEEVGVLFITPPSMKRTVMPDDSLISTGLKAIGNDAEACTAIATSMSGSVSALKMYSCPVSLPSLTFFLPPLPSSSYSVV